MDPDENLRGLVNASGFPFQLKVEDEIRKGIKKHGKRVLAAEHRWINPVSSETGFIDLILEAGTNVRLVVECKRIRGDGQWVFLVPKNATEFEHGLRILWSGWTEDGRPMLAWDGFNFRILSYASSICVVRGQGEKSPSMLERLVSIVIDSAECLADDELSYPAESARRGRKFYFPAIVTNARLVICRSDPEEINLETGEMPDASFEEVSMIRFTKSLPSRHPSSYPPIDIAHAAIENERTCLVINSGELTKVLSGEWEILPPVSNAGYPWRSAKWSPISEE